MSLFDDALKERFVTSPEIAAINVTSTDTLLIHDSATGTVMRMPVSILYSALGSAFASLIDGKVPASQLPSYVDDVLEYANFAALPATGETGKIYVTLDNNLTYRWSGSAYVEISASLALGETSSSAYRGDRGKTAYDHSQLTSGNPHATTKSEVGLGNVDNTSDANKPVSTAQAAAINALPSFGNWTPVLNCTSGTITKNSTYTKGAYIKIGRLVTLTAYIYVDSVSSPSGVFKIDGLPFATSSGVEFRTSGSVYADNLQTSAKTEICSFMVDESATLYFKKFENGIQNNIASDIKADTSISIQVSYITN